MSRPLPTLVATLALLAAVPAATAADARPAAAAPKPAKRYTIEQFMATVNIGGASFSADESRILFHSNETGIFNVYAMPVAGGKPVQITHSKTDSHYAVSFFPGERARCALLRPLSL